MNKHPIQKKFWTLEDILDLAHAKSEVSLEKDGSWMLELKKNQAWLEDYAKSSNKIYGIDTGFGESCLVDVPDSIKEELGRNLFRFHGCGTGANLSSEASAATLAIRICSLMKARSGVRPEVVLRLTEYLNRRLLPRIPEEGSVGASGDLTPMSYVAATLAGERELMVDGQAEKTSSVLEKHNLVPLTLRPRETLAIMNGTTIMTALSCLAFEKASYLSRLSSRLTAMGIIALQGNPDHFRSEFFKLKPHPGQTQIATWLRQDLALSEMSYYGKVRIQERYSFRCAPHIVGVLQDALIWIRETLEIEINSVNDNPVIDHVHEEIYHGGHFYGGHVGFCMDSLKNATANIADMVDRQVAILVDKQTNNGLPANLTSASSENRAVHHGLKALQIAISSWTAEALKLTLPASIFSRSTECHNQDKVSMGTHSARDAIRILELCNKVVAGGLIVATQAVQLREAEGSFKREWFSESMCDTFESCIEVCPPLTEDRGLEAELNGLCEMIGQQSFKLEES